MSRITVIVLVVLCIGVGVLISVRTRQSGPSSPASSSTDPKPVARGNNAATPPETRPANPVATTPVPTVDPAAPPIGQPGVGRTTVAARGTPGAPIHPSPATNGITKFLPINRANTNELPDIKPLPVLEKDYATATNRDTRLDIMMDIAETPSADAVRALTRLFEIETDGDLKVDLLDSLLGIEGFKEEKLIMLTMGARQGLPQEVRQSAIDGLIDLEDPRVVPVLNGLLNDPDPEIREGAQDALEMIQSAQAQPTVKFIK